VKKSFLVFLCALLLAGTLFAAGKSQQTAASSSKVTVGFTLPASWLNGWAMRDLTADWQTSTGNTLDIQAIPDDQYKTIVLSRLASGESADLLISDGGGTALNSFNPRANFADLSNEPWVSRVMDKQAFDQTFRVDGKVVMYPMQPGNAVGIVYSKKIFKNLNLGIPTTVDQFDQAMAAIKNAGIIPVYWAGKDGWTLLQHRSIAIAAGLATDPSILDKLNRNQAAWADIPGFLDAFKILDDWNKKGYFNSDIASTTYEMQNKAMASGAAAMCFQGSWQWGELSALGAKAEDFGMLGYPLNGKLYVDQALGGGIALYSKSKVPDAGKDFLNFLAKSDSLNKMYQASPGLPAFQGIQFNIDPFTADALKLQSAPHIDIFCLPPLPYDDLVKDYVEFLYGRMTPQQMVDSIGAAYVREGQNARLPGF